MPFGGKSYPEQIALLNQLQQEVNGVLEQTARLLKTGDSNNKAATAAQATKLKAILPAAQDRFNDALDNLGEEIDHAKLILRRDLAIAREKAGLSKPAPVVTAPVEAKAGSKRPSPDVEESAAPAAKRTKVSPEVDMPEKEHPSTPPTASDTEKDEPNAPSKPGAATSTETTEQPAEASQDTSAEGPIKSASEPQPPASEQDPKPSDNSTTLQIDTQPTTQTDSQPQDLQDSSKPPNTAATTNNADLESLFGGPAASLTADPANADATTTDLNNADDPFGSSSLGAGDFDFGLGSTEDNDNISALLPGLQDYANTQPGESGDVDFDAIFNTDLGAGGDGTGMGGNEGMGDFLDFDFGTGVGDAGGDAGGGTGNAVDEDDIFKFD